MTKEEIIGGAYLKLTSNYPTVDTAAWWEDVELLFAPAVNFVLNGSYFLDKREESEEKIIHPLFTQTFGDIPLTIDANTGRKTFTLPCKPLSLPKLRAITYIGDSQGNGFIPIENGGLQMQGYLANFKKSQTSFYVEGMRVFLENAPPLLKSVTVKMIVNASNLADSDEVFLPDGAEIRVMDMMVDFYTRQRVPAQELSQ